MSNPAGTLTCPNPACARHGDHTTWHDDTVLPIHCGGCGRELIPNPNQPSGTITTSDDWDIPDGLLDAITRRLNQHHS